MICSCALPSREVCVKCLCSDVGGNVSKLSSGFRAAGDGLSIPDEVVGEEPSEPEVDETFSGEL